MLHRPSACRTIPFPRVSVSAVALLLAIGLPVRAAVDLAQFTPDSRILDYSVYTTDSIWLPSGSGLANGGLFGSAGSIGLGDGMSLRAPRINAGKNFTLGGNPKAQWGIPSFYAGGDFRVGAGSVFNDSFQVGGNFESGSPDLVFRKALAVKGNLDLTGTNLRDSALLRLGGTYSAPGMSYGPAATVEMAAASGGPNLPGRVTYNKPWSQLQLLQTPMFPNLSTNLPGGAAIQGYQPPATRPFVDLSGPSVSGDAAVQFMSPNAITGYYWKCSSAGLPTGSCNGDTLLPGYYGDLTVTGNGRALLLTEGFYSFTSISIGGNNAIIAAQPKGSRTVVLSEGNVTAAASHAFIGPDSGRMATGYGSGANEFLGGTMMLISLSNITIPSDNRIWATLSAPYGDVHMSSQVRLFGQVYAKRLIGDNLIDFGAGAFIKIRTEMPVLQAPTFSVGETSDPACADPTGRPCRDTLITLQIPYTTAYTVTGRFTLVESSPRSAKAGIDFPAQTDTFSIPKGGLSARIRIRIFDDSSYEGPETFRIAFSELHAALCPDASGKGDSSIKTCYAGGTIVDDDRAPILRLFADSAVQEGNAGTKSLTLTVRLFDPITRTDTLSARNAPELPVGFKWRTADATALVSDNDYVAQVARWDSVPSLGLTRSITVPVRGDLRYEYDEWFDALVDSLRNGAFDGPASDSGIIRNDDGRPAVSFDPISVVEPASYGDTAWAVFRLKMSAPSGMSTSVWWSTLDSTAQGTSDFSIQPLDFFRSSGLAVIAPDSLGQFVRVAVFGDSLFEKSELFRLSIDSLREATGIGERVATIVDADAAPRVFVEDASVREPITGTARLRFRIRLERPSGLPASFVFTTQDGTARQPADYSPVTAQSVVLPAFSRDTLLDVIVLADSVAGESDETLSGLLSDVVDALPGDLAAMGVIQDAQDGFRLTIDSVAPVAEADSIVRFAVRTDWIPAHPIRLAYRTIDGTARRGYRYADTADAIVLPAGSREGSIAVRITKDSLWEPQEFFTLRIDSIAGANAPVATDSSARAWIYEEEELLFWFDSRDTAVREDSAGRVLAALRLSQPATIPIAFRLPLLAGSTASMPADFALTTEGWTWPPMTRETGFAVVVHPDARIEPDEVARVGFEPVTTGRLVGRESWNLTILDDDSLLDIVIVTPPDSLRTNQPGWTIFWRVGPTDQPRKDTVFTKEGWNCVERSATDRFGRVFSDTNCIWLDTTPPQVTVFKITGPSPHDRSVDTTWWGDRAKTRWGKDTVWYEVRDSVLRDDESGWDVRVDTLWAATDLRGDGEHAVPVSWCDSVGNCGRDTGWIELRQLVPLAVGGVYLDRDRDGRIDALVVELSRPWDIDFWPTFDAPLPPESRQGLRPDPAHPFVTLGGAVDSTRFLVPIVEPFRFGVTSFPALQGVLWEDWTTERGVADSFPIRDSVPPVVVKSEIHRVENYRDPDTLYVTSSELLVLEGDALFQVASCPEGNAACVDSLLVWTQVPARLVERLPDGRYRILVPPGIAGSVRPGFHLRFLDGVSDAIGNATDPANLRWSSVVVGGPRPDFVRVTVDRLHVGIPAYEAERHAPGGILIRATRGNVTPDGASRQWWERGRGYLADQDPSVQELCPDIRYCNGPTLYINRPVKMIIFIYDNAGTYVMSREVEITQADIDAMASDQIDRLSIELAWNHRDPRGQTVATGVYIWRILSTMRVEGSSLPVIDNQLYRLGVSVGE